MSTRRKNVKIVYTNWQGKTTERIITPIKIWFGNTEWHSEEQWFLRAKDNEKKAERDFALKDIQDWYL